MGTRHTEFTPSSNSRSCSGRVLPDFNIQLVLRSLVNDYLSSLCAVELDSEKAEKESLQARLWGMERTVKIIQSERDVMEEKLRDCISTFSDLRKSIGKVTVFFSNQFRYYSKQ